LITTIGLLVPYILAGVYFFWYDKFLWFWETQFINNLGFFDFNLQYNWETFSELTFFGLLFLIVFVSFGSYLAKKNLQVQKNITILYWALFFGFFTILIQAGIRLEHLLIFTIPLSILLSFNLSGMRHSLAEAVHLLLLVAILIFQFKGFWL